MEQGEKISFDPAIDQPEETTAGNVALRLTIIELAITDRKFFMQPELHCVDHGEKLLGCVGNN